MLKRIFLVICIITVLVMVSSCKQDNHEEDEGNGQEQNGQEQNSDEAISETLRILTYSFSAPNDAFFQQYVERFKTIRSDVKIVFEHYEADDVSQLISLITRLMADPPDIFHFLGRSLVLEKVALDKLFIDLNELIEGESGLNRDDFFDNIFRAMENQGGLYSIPIYVKFNSVLLNRSMFESIRVDWREMSTITIDEYLGYYEMIRVANPDLEVAMDNAFNIVDNILFSQTIYDVEAGVVRVDTPRMRELFERAVDIPYGEEVIFTPDALFSTPGVGRGIGHNAHLLTPTEQLYRVAGTDGTLYSRVLYLQEYPRMQFSQPVLRVSDDGSIRFESLMDFAIMRNSPNQELAWEFLRFMLSFDESLFDGNPGSRSYWGHLFFPVNRTRFDCQVREVFEAVYDFGADIWQDLFSAIDISREDYREESVQNALDFFHDKMEMLNHNDTINWVIMESLIYPDIWLLHTGQQSIERTLANIQNRLELYVAE